MVAKHQLKQRPKRFERVDAQGFTLVELVVVIAILALLVAVALPTYTGIKDKSKMQIQLGEAAGLAKECASAILIDGPYPADYASLTTTSGLTISANCNGGDANAPPKTPPTAAITYTTTAAPASTVSQYKCGNTALSSSANRCQVTVSTAGVVTYTPIN